MIYGNGKARHLARNTKTKSRQTLRSTKMQRNRQHRHRVSQHIREMSRDTELWHDDTQAMSDTHDKWFIQSERTRMHTQPIRRWAVATSKHLPIEQRLTHLRAKLPSGMVGRRATWWFRWMNEFDWAPHRLPLNQRHYWRRKQRLEWEKLIRQTCRILESPHLQSHLNLQLKRKHEAMRAGYRQYYLNPGTPRLLYGLHDITTSIADLQRGYRLEDADKRPCGHHPEWLQTFRAFCLRHHI